MFRSVIFIIVRIVFCSESQPLQKGFRPVPRSPSQAPIKSLNPPFSPAERRLQVIVEEFLSRRYIERIKSACSDQIIPADGKIREKRKPIFFSQKNEFDIRRSFGVVSKTQMPKIRFRNPVKNPIVPRCFYVIEKLKPEAPNPIGRDIRKTES